MVVDFDSKLYVITPKTNDNELKAMKCKSLKIFQKEKNIYGLKPWPFHEDYIINITQM